MESKPAHVHHHRVAIAAVRGINTQDMRFSVQIIGDLIMPMLGARLRVLEIHSVKRTRPQDLTIEKLIALKTSDGQPFRVCLAIRERHLVINIKHP